MRSTVTPANPTTPAPPVSGSLWTPSLNSSEVYILSKLADGQYVAVRFTGLFSHNTCNVWRDAAPTPAEALSNLVPFKGRIVINTEES